MNWNSIEGHWTLLKAQVRSQWSRLTDDHAGLIARRRARLIGLLQQNHGLTLAEASAQVRRFEELHKQFASKPGS